MEASSRTLRESDSVSVDRPIEPYVVGTTSQTFTHEELRFFSGWQPVTEVLRKDEAESSRVGRAIRATPKQCWFNGRRVVQKLDGYANASYAEGIAILDGGVIIEHGWVCRPDGTVIDPTLPRTCVAYFPGLEFVGRAGIEEFLGTPQSRDCKKSPFFYAFGWSGRFSPSFSDAWEKALSYARELSALQQEVSQDA